MLLSVDGLRPDVYRPPNRRHRFPHLNALEKAGASAEAVETIYPSTTYPAHATIVTGLPPREHGIYSHLASLDPTEKARPWCWFAQSLQAPALWDVARASRRKTAALSWPVSAGAGIDHNIPEIWDPAVADPHRDFDTPARHSTPGLFAEVAQVLMPMLGKVDPDQLRGAAAALPVDPLPARPADGAFRLVRFAGARFRPGVSRRRSRRWNRPTGRLEKFATPFPPIRRRRWWCCPITASYRWKRKPRPLVVFAEHGLFARGADGSMALRRLGAVSAGGSLAVYWLEEPSADDRRRLATAMEQSARYGRSAASDRPAATGNS